MDKSHGSPYDRGAADSYYGRRWMKPRKYINGTGPETFDLTEQEIREYYQGFNDNEEAGDFKDYSE